MAWFVERGDDKGNWAVMMYGPHRLHIDDIHGPSVSGYAGDYVASLPSPGNKSCFAGLRGWQARVRYNDTVAEVYNWERIPLNEFDPDSDTAWGWKLVEQNYVNVPFEELWPLSM